MKRINNCYLVSFIVLLLITGIFNFFATSAEAVPAAPIVNTHVQKDGTVIHYKLNGDEFLNYMTDSNGDLVAFAQDGDIYLASWAYENENSFNYSVPTDLKPIRYIKGSLIPAIEAMKSLKTQIPQYCLERAQQERDKSNIRLSEQFVNKTTATPMSMMSTTGSFNDRKVVMIYVSFNANPGPVSLPIPTSQTLYNMMFDENTWGTVANYYDTVTDGLATISPATTIGTAYPGIIFVQLPIPHGNWGDNFGSFASQVSAPALTQAANPTNPGGYIDYSYFDVDNNGILETDELAIGIIVHGYETAYGGISSIYPSIWAHAGGTGGLNINGVNIFQCFAQGAYHTRTSNPQLLTIGPIAHELGHSCFRFIDLYDINYAGNGIGSWSLMSSGSWGGNPLGSSPTALDAYHLYGGYFKSQIIAPKPVTYGTNTISGLTQYAKLATSDPNQYFLIQPRGNVGYDRGLNSWSTPNNGLLFFLVDDNLLYGANSLYLCNHYRVAVVPAGWATPTLPYNSYSLPTELFTSSTKTSISDATIPSSKIYATTSNAFPTVNSGWSIKSITSSVTGVGTNNGTVSASFFSDIRDGYIQVRLANGNEEDIVYDCYNDSTIFDLNFYEYGMEPPVVKFIPNPSNATITSILWESDHEYILYPDEIETPFALTNFNGTGYLKATVNGVYQIRIYLNNLVKSPE